MLYELRVYHMHPGKLPNINNRFRDVTLDIFARHGIKVCDYFEDAEGKDTIYYICAFENRKQRDDAFEAFRADPEWIAAAAASQVDGPIVDHVESFFMTRVPFVKPSWV
jgi:hypothetical protein